LVLLMRIEPSGTDPTFCSQSLAAGSPCVRPRSYNSGVRKEADAVLVISVRVAER